MNARTTTALTMSLFLAAAASGWAQGSQSATTLAPAASSGYRAAPQPASGQTMPKVSRLTTISEWDQQAPPVPPVPPAPPVPPSSGVSGQQAPKVQMPMGLAAQKKGQLVNVRVEFTITDQVGAKPPTKKTMSMTVAEGENSRIRTMVEAFAKSGSTVQRVQAPLSVDVSPVIEGAKIRLEFSLEYNLVDDSGVESAPQNKTTVSERLAVVLDSGVPLVVAQSSDALSDRKLTVEVKATVLR
ncbi:MAG: hypothetical protein NTY02_11550 [Acidobacteria bacterium]|nr:hypothetical protein [Acidobacteriota bacterium]